MLLMRPSMIVICGRSTTRPAITSIMRSAVTTTVSAYEDVAKRLNATKASVEFFIGVTSAGIARVVPRALAYPDEPAEEMPGLQKLPQKSGHESTGTGCLSVRVAAIF
jgi:hypothetical protein